MMKKNPANLFDPDGASYLTRRHLEERIRQLEAEVERLRRSLRRAVIKKEVLGEDAPENEIGTMH